MYMYIMCVYIYIYVTMFKYKQSASKAQTKNHGSRFSADTIFRMHALGKAEAQEARLSSGAFKWLLQGFYRVWG